MRTIEKEQKEYCLTQDNGSCNDFKKLKVTIKQSVLEKELKTFFGWRKDVNYERLLKQGSSEYDKFILYLSNKGYK